ncbi:tRNA methyltransferase complex GCD14 subunit-domain-containing protein [Gymnopilus junonius]|uniref:tRNA (adenine(58)-N(1))-methyltransferase catalytic subunit TRM61 n=1 Tax=Gymnopilus junonius TaxID=109634 RepID=A0A9P5NIQ2_GYMJU|nr:tRNA methyltransferase complex GCD14 subunit-domain-containing protein [Gymnopilus junonius]
MWSSARHVAAGDTVIVWLTRDQVQPLVVTPGKDFNTKFGNFRQADFVGVPYGSKVPSRTGRGFVHILRPTPELWTIALPHRTQILYLADISFITSCLNIRQGSKVIEAGTGSGSFSHSIARTVGPLGHLYSYEFHEARFAKAKEEFTRHGMDDTVTVQHRNVCKDGFTVIDEVDAVFLDLPAPWEAAEHAKKALRKDRVTRICCFSPCIEQVLRTVNALNEAGFTEITMFETLLRPIEVFQVPQMQSVSVLSDKLKKSEQKREDKRLRQIAANKAAAATAAAKPKPKSKSKRKRGEVEDQDEDGVEDRDVANVLESKDGAAGEGTTSNKNKRVKTEMDNATSNADGDVELPQAQAQEADVEIEAEVEDPTLDDEDMDVLEESAIVAESNTLASSRSSPTAQSVALAAAGFMPKMNVSKALPEVRGHTSYLTFACLIPVPASTSTFASSASAPPAAAAATTVPLSSDANIKPEPEQAGELPSTGKATTT